MLADDKIKDEKLQYDTDRKTAKISVFISGKFDKHKYLTSEEISPFHQSKMITQAQCTYDPLGKAIEKERKAIED